MKTSLKSSQPILRVRHIWRTRGSGQRSFTLRLAKLDVFPGNFVALVGPSGSGKSTLLDILSLVLEPTGGESLTLHDREGEDIDILSCWRSGNDTQLAQTRRRLLGYVLQTGGLLPYLNVLDNISLPLHLLGEQPDRKVIESHLEHFGLHGFESKNTSSLSGGERQRVAIIRALIHQPSIILADEPTAALDHAYARTVVEHFRSLALQQNTAIIMVTHDEPLVNDLADTVIRFYPENHLETGTCYSAQVEQRGI